ncbi:MAG: L-lactate permease, partial [Bacillota bacterium]|nr:L-lactate permease [Bacillota bacterium]
MFAQNFTAVGGSLGLTALVALIPILYFFWALAIKRMKGHIAGLTTLLVALVVAVVAYKMPAGMAVMSATQGAIYGVLPIGWIIITSVFLYKLTVKTGQFDIIRYSVLSITEDRRLQVLLVAFSFGAFLEGAAGFGAPVAIAAALLVGLGFNPLMAAGLALVANTAPVAFGAIGIPVIGMSGPTALPAGEIAKAIARQLPVLAVFVPFYVIFIMAGFKKMMEVLPAILVSGLSFAITQYVAAYYLGP